MSDLNTVVDKVQRILVKNYSGVTLAGDGDEFFIDHGSTRVWISCMKANEELDDIIVQVGALVAADVSPSPELYKEVATSYMGRAFGCSLRMFPADEEHTKYMVVLESRILGNFLDEDELRAAVEYSASSADYEDDGFAARHGGTVFNPDGNRD